MRRRPITIMSNGWMTAAVVLLVAAFLALNWYYYSRIRISLDREFSLRLEAIATLAASAAAGEAGRAAGAGVLPAARADSLREKLSAMEDRFELSSVQILGEDGTVIVSTRPGIFPAGELYPLWNMDFEEILDALDGKPSATGTYRTPGGDYLKAGYAPVEGGSGPAAAVAAVEAGVDFLEGLADLRNILIAATSISIAGAVVFVWLIARATGSLVRARESLISAENLASMGRMAAGIAHEVRNPLFIIRSSAEKLKRSHPSSARDIDEFILDEVDRLDGILSDYLLFAREEKGRFQETDLAAVLRRSIRLVAESAGEDAPPIAERFGAVEAPALGEEKRLQQVFMNVLLNAIEACRDGGSIETFLEEEGGSWRIVFTDTGKGIPEGELSSVFEPFYTTRPAGSGLGLAVARSVVEEHSGSISIESTEGRGTSVEITLPRASGSRGEHNDQSPGSR